ncbi:B-cell receptor-associated protein 31-like-domain-containing protein [Syncephalastrum racemosum]|uniref:Endoplasmic reticulum transmembrane protein n=1 Tax=Syncephalastrum racemosum TaxID=13706 RepID=A0A1X2HLJ0_SYNRA|nr:B-cell receptor-associated protein 31-like-domain-containing protein [Syncephalastrum racemosum]
MTLYYTIVFAILLLEASCILYFLVLMIPLPTQLRKKALAWLSNSPSIAYIKHVLRIVFVCIFVLFLDAINRLNTLETAVLSSQQTDANPNTFAGAQAIHDVHTDANFAAKQFYAQRNIYLTGSTLFLTLVLQHTYNITVELVQLQEQVQMGTKDSAESKNAIEKDTSSSDMKKEL